MMTKHTCVSIQSLHARFPKPTNCHSLVYLLLQLELLGMSLSDFIVIAFVPSPSSVTECMHAPVHGHAILPLPLKAMTVR